MTGLAKNVLATNMQQSIGSDGSLNYLSILSIDSATSIPVRLELKSTTGAPIALTPASGDILVFQASTPEMGF